MTRFRTLPRTHRIVTSTIATTVLDTYGRPHHLTDDQTLERHLALSLERAAQPES